MSSSRLSLDRGDDLGCGVPDVQDRDAGGEVDQAVAVDVLDDRVGRPGRHDRMDRPDARGHRVRPPIEPLAGPRARDLGDELAFLRDVHRRRPPRPAPARRRRPARPACVRAPVGSVGRRWAACQAAPRPCLGPPVVHSVHSDGPSAIRRRRASCTARTIASMARHRQGHPGRARDAAAPAGGGGRTGRARAVGPRERARGPDPVAAGRGADPDDRHERGRDGRRAARVRPPPGRGPASRVWASGWGSTTTPRRRRSSRPRSTRACRCSRCPTRCRSSRSPRRSSRGSSPSSTTRCSGRSMPSTC